MNLETAHANDAGNAVIGKAAGMFEGAKAEGHYEVVCRNAAGEIVWEDVIENLVCTPGKNLCLDSFFAGSAYTTVGPFMGLADSSVASATVADETGHEWTFHEDDIEAQ